MKIAVVTDSTCDWTQAEYEENQVFMVPLKILVDGESFLDQHEISSEEFYDRMAASEKNPSTSQPSPGDFIKVYQDLAAQGFDAAVSIHIAPVLSGTYESALLAAGQVDIPVAVIDSKTATSGLGLLVGEACALRDQGCTLEEMKERLMAMAACTKLFLAPENTDNLVKGGRLSEEQAQGVAMLNVKLVFTLDDDGRLINFDKVKGSKGILRRYVEVLAETAQEQGPLKIRFMQARNQDQIDRLLALIEEAGIECEIEGIDSCGATVATHTGIGVTGFGVMPLNV